MRLHIGAALRMAVWTSSWFVASSPYARAEPALHVRAQTRLELHAQHGGNLVRVEGLLSDDLDQPLPGRSVQLTLEGADPDREQPPIASRTLRTDESGHFVQALTRGSGRYALRARFAGDGMHEASSVTEVFDATRADVQLAIDAPRVLALDEASIAVEVRASSEAGAEGLSIALHDEAGRELASGTSDAAGSFRTALDGERLGEPGSGQLVANSAEGESHAAGRAVLSVLRQRATTLQLTAAYVADAGGVHIAGELRTRRGPLASATIGLYVDGEHALTLRSDAAGRFEHVLPFERGAEPLVRHVGARFDPDTPALKPSRSSERAVTIPARPAPNLLWVLVPCAVSLALSFFVLRRSGSWLARRERPPSFAPGVQLGATRSRGGPALFGLDGVIEDADTTERLANASLRVTRADGLSFVAQIAKDGSFAILRLDPGTYRVEARAPGYALEASSVRIPHAGEGRGLRVRLRSLRTLALDAHRPLLQRVFPAREQQQAATARETLRGAPSSWPRAELEQLTTLVENTAYAPNEPTAEHVQEIESNATDLLQRRQ